MEDGYHSKYVCMDRHTHTDRLSHTHTSSKNPGKNIV